MDAFALQSLGFSQTTPTLTQNSPFPYFFESPLASMLNSGGTVGVPIPGTNLLLGSQTNTVQSFMAQALLQPSQQLGSIWSALSGGFGGLGGLGGGLGSSFASAFAFSAPPPPADNCHHGYDQDDYNQNYNQNYNQDYSQSYSESYTPPQQQQSVAIAVNTTPPAAAVSYG